VIASSHAAAPLRSPARLSSASLLYAVEKTIRDRSAGERRAVRQEKSKPLVLALKAWLEQQLARVSAKATVPEDIRYALNHWDGPTGSADHGRIELDSNIIERGTRPLFSIKNVLFAGHDQGAENWACVASFIETRKLNCVDRQAYRTGVLTKLVISGRPRASTSSCHGPGRRSTRQTVKRRDAKLRIDKVIKSSKPCGQKPLSRKRPLPAPEEPPTIALGEPIKRPYRRGRVGAVR
jgi:hypothetical protein